MSTPPHQPAATQTKDQTGLPRIRKMIGERGDYFLNRIQGETGVNLTACYQCERCTNACPASYFMDIKPHQVIRYVQLGWREELLHSTTIWVCLACEMCTTYCPNMVDVAETINYLRTMAASSTVTPKERHLAVFHQTFLEQLHKFGRVNEFWLMNAFNLKPNILKEKIQSGMLQEEIALGLALIRKGKLNLIPRRSRAIRQIDEIYRRRRGEIV
jgi:heterodisulfide reductase subunit C